MDTFLAIAAIVLGVLGIIGSIVPALPGPPVSWIGMLLMFLRGEGDLNHSATPLSTLLIWLGITTLVTILDFVIPGWFTKVTGGSKYAAIGATVGLLAGMFFTPVGIVAGVIIGAFAAELIFAGKSAGSSVKSALGAFLGFICGTGLKLVVSGMMLINILLQL